MLHEDHIQTQYTHYQYKRQDDALEGVGSVLTKSEAEHIKVSEEEHETRTGNEIVGEEGRFVSIIFSILHAGVFLL